MTILSCSATTCVYNKDELCSKGDIRVGGERAQHPSETCCESFIERNENSMSNSTGSASGTIDVDCDACDCTFNKEKKCSANAIEIEGSDACDTEETECASFRSESQ